MRLRRTNLVSDVCHEATYNLPSTHMEKFISSHSGYSFHWFLSPPVMLTPYFSLNFADFRQRYVINTPMKYDKTLPAYTETRHEAICRIAIYTEYLLNVTPIFRHWKSTKNIILNKSVSDISKIMCRSLSQSLASWFTIWLSCFQKWNSSHRKEQCLYYLVVKYNTYCYHISINDWLVSFVPSDHCEKGIYFKGPLLLTWVYLSLIRSNSSQRISNSIHYKLWDEITYPFPNVKSGTVEVREWDK